MRCPQCGHGNSRVVDSRPAENNASIRRRRECEACGFRYTTYERMEDVPLVVIKRDGSREPFNREKLLRGLLRATVKRDVPLASLESLVDSVERDLRDASTQEIPSRELGEAVLAELLPLDTVAYVRFASVYRDFQDLDEFQGELRRLSERQKETR